MTFRYLYWKTRVESLCTKLNDGLMAVALVLAMTVLMVGTYRTVQLLETMAPAAAGQWGDAAAADQAAD